MPKSVQATAEGMPKTDYSEPLSLSEAIRLYRRGLAEYDFRSFDMREDQLDELADTTYVPHFQVLEAWDRPAETAEEAEQALWLAMHETGGVYGSEAAIRMISAAHRFLSKFAA